jgi:hypothetical protein
MKTSIPKLHSIKWKSGAFAENVVCLDNYQQDEGTTVENVLRGAYEAGLRDIVVMGYKKEDGSEYVAGSSKNVYKAHYMFARGALLMMRQAD